MCHLTPSVRSLQQAIPHSCPAKALKPSQRLTMGLQALAGTQSITGLADAFDVSRKYVYRQAATAQAALQDAFTPSAAADDLPLFYLPVTKNWLRQAALSLTLTCHSSYRGVVEFCRDILDVHWSVGTVHNIVRAALDKARPYNLGQDLANVDIAGLDEIYQNRQPVLVGADIASTYCFLLSLEDHPDADTWAIRLLEAQERGLAPQATVADFGSGIRAGVKLAQPDIPCRGDVFHALAEITAVATYLEKRAYDAIATHHKLQQKKAKVQRQARGDQAGQIHSLGCKASSAAQAAAEAVSLADDIALLTRWLRHDVFAVSGLPYADRCALFDFILTELQARAPLYRLQLDPVCTVLKNHREQLLAFAAQLDQDLAALAAQFEVPVAVVRALLDLQVLNQRQPKRWQKEAALRQQLRHRFYHLQQAVHELAETRKLLAEVRSGDPQALGRLLTRHQPYLQRFIELRLDPRLRGRLDPVDVVQEAQMQAVRRLPRYLEQHPMPFRLWLRRLAQDRLLNLRRDHIGTARRSVAREVSLPEDSAAKLAGQLLNSGSTPSQRLSRQELAQRVREAMGRLSESEREVLVLRHFEGLSNPEVAALLGLAPGTVSKRYGRAVLRLHNLLFENGLTESKQ